MAETRPAHDHTHIAPAELAPPQDHSHALAPGVPHLHGHEGHPQGGPVREGRPALTTTEIAVAVKGVCAGYFGRDVLDEVTFEVRSGEFIGIIGPSGSGKSTLLKVIAGLLPVQCGSVLVFGQRPSPEVRHLIGYVPQSESVNWSFPVTVRDVVLMGKIGR